MKAERDAMMFSQRGTSSSKANRQRIDERINELIRMRKQKLQKTYTRPVIQPPTISVAVPRPKLDTQPRSDVAQMNTERNKITLKMTPVWFETDNQQVALKGIVYPSNTTDHRPFNTVARYRIMIGQSNDFCKQALAVGENSTETLILMLDAFAQQFGADLSFTNDELPFDKSAYGLACGIANLGNAHLLAANYVPTAKFSVILNLDYNKSFAGSDDSLKDFLFNFSKAIAQTLNCSEEYIKVFSIEKSAEISNSTIIHFGFTSPNQKETKQIAHDFQTQARSGFRENAALEYIKPIEYSYTLTPMISYLQLRLKDFVPEHNVDYRKAGLPESEQRGGYPYYSPIGWYYHALKVDQKYPNDNVWFGSVNAKGEWPVAFHGTHSSTVSGVIEQDFLKSTTQTNVASQETMDQSGFYLTTHCNGGAHPHCTTPFRLEMPDKKNKTFRVVFMCRVQPDKFTIHQAPALAGHIWRLVDSDAVRPYGILIKDEDARNN
ncbi:unnamed protein product [Rotaria sp. Silwood1]|nr:unnamed protein product [Rotaria sp. Silwood1]